MNSLAKEGSAHLPIIELEPQEITRRARDGTITISIVGMGHVGLPLGLVLVSEGARVIGCDNNATLLEQLDRGESPIVENGADLFSSSKMLESLCPNCGVRLMQPERAEAGKSNVVVDVFCPNCMKLADVEDGRVRLTGESYQPPPATANVSTEIATLLRDGIASKRFSVTSRTKDAVHQSDVVIITVGTPIDEEKKPDTRTLISACREIGRGLRKGSLVVLKSTVSPGTTEDLVAPILAEESGLVPGTDFGLAHMPENTMEGLALLELRTLPKIVGGIDRRSSEAAAAVFELFGAPIHIFESPRITEAAKLFENIYRDVNIALANELALACEKLGLDVSRVIAAAHTDPKTHLLTPGPGVGGYCLPPWTQVQTEGGLRPISEIKVGDRVLGHDGLYHNVTRVFSRPYDGPLLQIAGRAFYSFPIECTPEHRILARKRIPRGRRFYNSKGKPKLTNMRGLGKLDFIPSDQIEVGDVLCLPVPLPRIPSVPSVPFSYDYHRRGIWQEIASTPEMMYLFGMYIAEGSTWDNQTTFALHKDERFIIEELDSITSKTFGNRTTLHRIRGEGMTARLSCRPLADYLRKTFGHNSWEKRVPIDWLTSLPDEHLKSLVRGIWLGDGSKSDNRFVLGTTSVELWNFVQLALLRLRVKFAVNYGERHQGRDGVWHRRAYYIKSVDIGRMNEIVHPIQRLVRLRKEYRTTWFQDGFFVFPVRSVTRTDHTGEVWNLEVEDANSYVLQGGIVHNCLPKDPYYLTDPASKHGFRSRILKVAREVNDGMPAHVVDIIERAFEDSGSPISGSKIAVLGLAFKGNTADTRQSPSIPVIEMLVRTGAVVEVHDPLADLNSPYVPHEGVTMSRDLRTVLASAKAVVLLTDHLEYRTLTAKHLRSTAPSIRIIVDTRRVFDPAEVEAAGLLYRAVGVGEDSRSEKKKEENKGRKI